MPLKATDFFGNIEQFKKNHKGDIRALKALHTGTANDRQQQAALAFIIKHLCQADKINYYETDRDTSFALGREAVGKVLRGLILDPNWLTGEDHD